MIRAVLMDGSRLVLEAIAAKFHAESDFELVGVAMDCESGLALVTMHEPDLIVMEVDLPGIGSFGCAEEVLRVQPRARISLLTGCLSDVLLDSALRLGISGYLLKEEPFTVLFDNLRRIAHGERRFSARVKPRLQREARQAWLQTRSAACLSALTHQQWEVLRHLARGDSVKEVAVKMACQRARSKG